MLSITINAETLKDLTNQVSALLADLTSSAPVQPTIPQPVAPQVMPQALAQQVATPTPAIPQPVAPTAVTPQPVLPTAPAPAYTQDDLARAAVQLSDAGKRDVLFQILASFGIQYLPQLPKEQYAAFAVKLREQGANI